MLCKPGGSRDQVFFATVAFSCEQLILVHFFSSRRITMRHTISVLVENEFGVVSRVASLFSSRGFNIDSFIGAPTNEEGLSRITIVTHGDESVLEQITKQLNKLIDIVKVIDFSDGSGVEREMALIKVTAEDESRACRRSMGAPWALSAARQEGEGPVAPGGRRRCEESGDRLYRSHYAGVGRGARRVAWEREIDRESSDEHLDAWDRHRCRRYKRLARRSGRLRRQHSSPPSVVDAGGRVHPQTADCRQEMARSWPHLQLWGLE